ncbi:putative serine--tRNA ligase DIA4 Ecym_4530 [Eremothecium cymbalariae DBVPG|uniref:serine--tRNA ligase n=1 Tax=Eremothecium cymbalariae (strain CBS 270.75 / DBVPG 7215 / KCTC 17166 / NRRL Y-17582) TaxID=931890 RepID=G8JU64_ERECY|nr:hypothetical protein Ecym_4530 [Eremothecium cymbalariae DBVPG\
MQGYRCHNMVIRRFLHTHIPCYLPLRKPQFDTKAIVAQLQSFLKAVEERDVVSADELISQLKLLPEQQKHSNAIDKAIKDIQIRRKKLEAAIKSDQSEAHTLKQPLKQLKQEFQELTEKQKTIKDSMLQTCLSLPNLTATDVPSSEPEVVSWINPKDNYTADPRREHQKIMIRKGMVDFQTASAISGSSWYYLLNEGAMLEHALVNYVSKKARQWGFKMCLPPSIVRNEVIVACGFKPRDMNNERQIYHLSDTQLGLVATAEISLAGLGVNRTLDLTTPIGLFGVSRSYRAEAGASGRDTKGLYRVHEFTKVELFYWAKPEESALLLERLRELQTEIFTELGLSARVLNMPKNDLGSPAYKKYDIEVWMPGRGSFGEVSSASNCTDYQSRRLHTTYMNTKTGKLDYSHTLNGTAMAIPRVILAIVENFYDTKNDRINIPEVLRPYMEGLEYI